MRLLITGGAGFVGSTLGIFLKTQRPRFKIKAFDNLKRRGSEQNLPRLKSYGIEFLHGDVRSLSDLQSAGSFDLLLDCAAEPSVLAGHYDSPAYLINTNLLGTFNSLEVARLHKAAFILLSTSRVYSIAAISSLQYDETETRFSLSKKNKVLGLTLQGIDETFSTQGVRSFYGSSKLASEMFLQEYQHWYGLKGLVNRCGVLTGPWQMGKVDQGFVALWLMSHLLNQPLQYIGFHGLGKQVRDILHVDDLARLILYQIENLNKLSGSLFNVGGGLANIVSLQELTVLCQKYSGKKIKITPNPKPRPMDIPWYVTNNAHVTKTCEWTPKKNVEQILEDILNWVIHHDR